jgi:hypothetical protein
LNSKAYHVESGLLRNCSIDEKGKEHICLFASEDWIIADNCKATYPCVCVCVCMSYHLEQITDLLFHQEKLEHK